MTDPSIDRELALSAMVELVQELVTGANLRAVMAQAAQRIARLSKVERVSVVLLRSGGEHAFVLTSSDAPGLRELPIRLANYPELMRCIHSASPVLVADVALDLELEPLWRELGFKFRSSACIPLGDRSRTVGVLFLRCQEPARIDAGLVELLTIWGRAAGVAVMNAERVQSLQAETQHSTEARQQAERRMRVFQPYAEFFKDSADGMVVMEPTGRILFANPLAKQLAGSVIPLEGANVADFLPTDERTRGRELAQGFSRGNYPKGVDFKVNAARGVRTVNVNFSATLRTEGAVMLTFRDVTQDRHTEQELTKTKNFLESVIESSVDAIVSADLNGRVLLFNRAAARIFGYEPREVLSGMNVAQLYPPGIARTVMRLIRSDDFGGRDRLEGYQVNMLSSSGNLIPVSISAGLIYEGSKAIGSVGIFTDIRDQLRMQAHLREAQDRIRDHEKSMAVAQLAGATAHELNQPLTTVMAYSELLLRKLDPSSGLVEAATILVSEAERMANIVRKIGRITRYETKSYVGGAQILDLERSVEDPNRDYESRGPNEDFADTPSGAAAEPED
ncbi:MAG TPA: PAS domain S-box protein [Polyangiaceae bacterium]|nr:PAS domain S-box protein [Polyangiaceae bacterium]